MPNSNMVKSRYLGKRGNPFDQFEKVVTATQEMGPDVHKHPTFYFQLASELIANSNPDAARKLLAYRILTLLQQLEVDEYKAAYANVIFQMRGSGFWIEKAFCQSNELNQVENTLFAPQPFHFGATKFSSELRAHIRNRTPESSREALWRTITRIHEETTKQNAEHDARRSIFFEPIFGKGLILLDALGEVHFESSDNASRHALHTDDNENSFDLDDEGFFGDVQYLQMNAISHLAGQKRQKGDWPDPIIEYITQYLKKKNSKGGRFLALSYVDNGPGIVEHVSKFASNLATSPSSISEVIDRQLTASSVPGAGYGLSNMRDAIESIGGFIFIQSGAHIHHFNGLNRTSKDISTALGRGTLLTFIVPT